MASASSSRLLGGTALQAPLSEVLPALQGRRRLPSRAQRSGARTLLRIEAVAAPEQKTTTPADFRAWDFPSAKNVAKRTDLKK